jgi:hypothetical protein
MHEMTESRFRATSCFRASDGGFVHEMHETPLRGRASCMPSCTGSNLPMSKSTLSRGRDPFQARTLTTQVGGAHG